MNIDWNEELETQIRHDETAWNWCEDCGHEYDSDNACGCEEDF